METKKQNETGNSETAAGKPVSAGQIININVSRIIMGLMELGNLEIEDFDTNIKISKTIANLSTIEKAYSKTMSALMKKHIEQDEKGNLASASGVYIFKSVKDKEEYQKAIDILDETVVNEKIWKIKASDLKKIKGVKATTMARCFEIIEDDFKLG